MFEVTILIPTADNDGKGFDPSHHAQFERLLIERFGGFTRYGEADGAWEDQGTLYRDKNLVVGIAVRTITDGAALREVVEVAKRHYRQLAIYLRYLGQVEVL